MRIRIWTAAAAAAACVTVASPAAAMTTITQSLDSSFAAHASRGPAPIGGLNLSGGRQIISATLNYAYYAGVSQIVFPGDPVTFTYGGTAGFAVFNLPVPFYMSTSGSGSSVCGTMSCSGGISGSGTINVPLADFAAFAGAAPLIFSAQGQVTGTVGQANRAVYQADYYSGASGTITYLISDGALPEPATWAMMIAGVGLIGATLRRRARVAVSHA